VEDFLIQEINFILSAPVLEGHGDILIRNFRLTLTHDLEISVPILRLTPLLWTSERTRILFLVSFEYHSQTSSIQGGLLLDIGGVETRAIKLGEELGDIENGEEEWIPSSFSNF